MKFLTPLLLLLCMLVAVTALAGDPLDTNDSPACYHPQVAVLATAPATVEQPVRGHTRLEQRTNGEPLAANDTARMTAQVWVPNVGLIDLFWWLRK